MENTLSKKSRAWKLGFAGLATAALTLTGFTPAFAADVQVGPEIAGFEVGGTGTEDGFNYDQWHVGSVTNQELTSEASLEFGECSVTVLDVPENSQANPEAKPATITQVLKGFAPDARPTSNVDDVQALIDSISIDVESGSVTLQVPFFAYPGSTPEKPYFTTVRNDDGFGPGVHTFADADGALRGSNGNRLFTDFDEVYASFAAAGANEYYQLLGIGFTGTPGTVINSISFGGDTYYFGTGDCLPAVEESGEETPGEETPAGDAPDAAASGNAVAVTAPKKPVIVDTGVLN